VLQLLLQLLRTVHVALGLRRNVQLLFKGGHSLLLRRFGKRVGVCDRDVSDVFDVDVVDVYVRVDVRSLDELALSLGLHSRPCLRRVLLTSR